MKFAEHLAAHITPEWRKQYINYEVSAKFRSYRLKTERLLLTSFVGDEGLIIFGRGTGAFRRARRTGSFTEVFRQI